MDAFHYWGNDLNVSATGGLLLADGLEQSKQRILRRLLTNPGDYIWELDYGAGLPSCIGQTLNVPELTALIRSQMYLEASVSHEPEPDVAVQTMPNGIAVQITYTDIETGQSVPLYFDVTP